jgi:D-glycero-alpha-D-manno-heptose-7-phosphate kinase
MIITKTPYRISLFGGGSDHPVWYKKHGGEVISFAIDKYCYISTRILPPFFDHKYRITYSKIETVDKFEKISHPAVREAIRKFCPELSLEIQHHGDLPARSGVGSSSAFAVGLIHSLLALQSREISWQLLANEAIKLEQEDLKENVGSQDQIACSLGGLNYINFGGDLNWQVTPIQTNSKFVDLFMDRVILVYTGIPRISSDVQKSLLENIESKKSAMDRMVALSRESRKIIENNSNLDLIGEMLDESWSIKREMNSAAITPALDDFYTEAKSAGAIGGKVLGAGGGGFCMFWIKEGEKEYFLRKFKIGLNVPVKISNHGSICL